MKYNIEPQCVIYWAGAPGTTKFRLMRLRQKPVG